WGARARPELLLLDLYVDLVRFFLWHRVSLYVEEVKQACAVRRAFPECPSYILSSYSTVLCVFASSIRAASCKRSAQRRKGPQSTQRTKVRRAVWRVARK